MTPDRRATARIYKEHDCNCWMVVRYWRGRVVRQKHYINWADARDYALRWVNP